MLHTSDCYDYSVVYLGVAKITVDHHSPYSYFEMHASANVVQMLYRVMRSVLSWHAAAQSDVAE